MSTENKVPAIRFEGFSGEIPSIKLKEIVMSNTYGPRFNSNDYDVNGNVKTIRGTDISAHGCILYNQVPIAKLDINFIKSHILEDGDLIMITTADCGLTGIFEKQKDNYIGSAYAVKITLNKALAFPHYFKYFFQTRLAKNEVNKYIRKATVANLPASAILKITHRLPSKHEQEKIALFLTSLYKLISQHQQKHDKLLNIKKSLLEKMFPKQGEDVPEIRFKGFSGAWEETTLGCITTYTKGFAFKSADYESGGIRIIRVSDLTTDSVSESASKIYLNNKANEYSDYEIKSGDIVITTVGSKAELRESAVGRAIAFTESKGYLLNQNLVKIMPLYNYDSHLIYIQLLREKYSQFIEEIQRGNANQANIAINDLWKYPLKCPAFIEQTKIGNLFKSLDQLITQHQTQLNKLKNIKQACLEKMFV